MAVCTSTVGTCSVILVPVQCLDLHFMQPRIGSFCMLSKNEFVHPLLLQVSQILYQIQDKYGLLQELHASVRDAWQAEYLRS